MPALWILYFSHLAKATWWFRGEDQVPQLPVQIFSIPTSVNLPAAFLV